MRFADSELEKFKTDHQQPVRPVDRRVNTNSEWVLTPSRSPSARPRAIRVSREEWLEAIRICRLNGYVVPDDMAGLPASEVKRFSPTLQRGLAADQVADDSLRHGLELLLAFVQGEGQGGFSMVKGWKR